MLVQDQVPALRRLSNSRLAITGRVPYMYRSDIYGKRSISLAGYRACIYIQLRACLNKTFKELWSSKNIWICFETHFVNQALIRGVSTKPTTCVNLHKFTLSKGRLECEKKLYEFFKQRRDQENLVLSSLEDLLAGDVKKNYLLVQQGKKRLGKPCVFSLSLLQSLYLYLVKGLLEQDV